MDELDQERSTAQAMAAAAAAAALFAGLALAVTRKRGENTTLDLASGITGISASDAAADARLADQVVALAPEVVQVLEQHVPDSMRRLRDWFPTLRRPPAYPGAVASETAERVSDVAEQVDQSAEAEVGPARQGVEPVEIDLSALTPAQAAAARAAAAAVARAEQALSAVGTVRSRSRETGQEAADDIAQALRQVAHQAAEVALDLWEQARGRIPVVGEGETAGEAAAHLTATVFDGARGAGEKARQEAAEAAARAQGIAEEVADRASAAGEKAHDLGDRAKQGAREAADATVETGKESVSAFAWLVAAITVVVYVLLKPERRESLTRFADEAVVQAQELLRDLRGYDDEF
jgi:hypothetical protein